MKRITSMAILNLLLAGSAFAQPVPPPAAPPPADPAHPVVMRSSIVAAVNDVMITYGALEDAIFEQIPNVTGHGTISPQRLRDRAGELLEQLIREELLIQEADRLGVKINNEEVQAEIARQRAAFQSEAEFLRAMGQRGLNIDRFRAQVQRAMRTQKLVEQEVLSKVTVSEEEMAAYYKANPKKFVLPKQVRYRLLLLRVDPSASPQEWDQTRVQAVALRERAIKGEDFAALVREYSDDIETREHGGDTGWVHHGQLGLPTVEHAAENLPPGEVAEPVSTLYGYYLALVVEKKSERLQPYDALNKELFRQELIESKRLKQYQEWFEKLRSKAEITTYSPPLPAP